MIEFRDALTDLLEEFGTDDGGFKGDLPEGRYMRVDSKNFYFDIGQNNRGIYMRISEVRVPAICIRFLSEETILKDKSSRGNIFFFSSLITSFSIHQFSIIRVL